MNMFNSVQCAKGTCSRLFNEWFSKSSEDSFRFDVRYPFPLKRKIVVMGRTIFEVWCSIVRSQKWGVWVRLPLVHSMFEKVGRVI